LRRCRKERSTGTSTDDSVSPAVKLWRAPPTALAAAHCHVPDCGHRAPRLEDAVPQREELFLSDIALRLFFGGNLLEVGGGVLSAAS
jgi:hypothetical protein